MLLGLVVEPKVCCDINEKPDMLIWEEPRRPDELRQLEFNRCCFKSEQNPWIAI